MSSATSFFQTKTLSWQGLFVIGIAGLVVALYKAWSSSAPPNTFPQSHPAAPAPVARSPALPSVSSTLQLPSPVSPVQTVAPVSSFTPSRIMPDLMPADLRNLGRPPPDPPPLIVPPGVQPGYIPPDRPEPRDIR